MRITLDCETWLIAPGRLAPPLVSVAFAVDGGLVKLFHTRDPWADALLPLVSNPAAVLVGHNLAYDLAVLIAADGRLAAPLWAMVDEGRTRDTMLRAQLIAIALGHFKFDAVTGKPSKFSLADLVSKHLGETVEGKSGPDVWRLRYRELADVPLCDWPEAATEYARLDVSYTDRVWLKLEEYRAQTGVELPDETAQNQAAWALHLASVWGVRTDPQAVAELRARLEAGVAESRAMMTAAGILRANGSRDNKALQGRVLDAYNEFAPTTDKGAVRLNEETLRGSGDALLVAIADASADEKELSTFVPQLEAGARYPINARWHTLVESGRVSCSNPNLTNQPRRPGVRECYQARPGTLFASADYNFAELCTLAQTCYDWFGESKLRDAINAKIDPHLVTAASILGLPLDEVVTRHAAKDAQVKDARQLAKAANFGFPGGLGAATFIEFARATYGVRVSEDEARELKRAFVSAFPEMEYYWKKVGAACNGGSFTGALLRSGRQRGGLGFCDGCNYFFQGSVADAAKSAFYRLTVEGWRGGGLFAGGRPLILMHDEIIAEVPEEGAHEAAVRLATVMIEELSAVCPDVLIRAEPSLMRRWYKSAEPVYDGVRLVPWEPKS
jgi:DNA polymerase-1